MPRSLTTCSHSLLLAVAALLALAGCDGPEDENVVTGTTTSADSVQIHYATGGEGPAVVLIHCWGGDQSFYRETARDLRADYTVVTLDLAGHGASGQQRDEYTMNAFAHDVLAVMDTAGVRQTVLVGHSMGGLVAMETARLAPDRVRGIVGIDNLHRVEHGYTRQDIYHLVAPMRVKFEIGRAHV